MDQRFTIAEVERITGSSRRQLEYWSRLGLVRPQARWGERFFNFKDLVAVETLHRLASRRVPARRLRRAMDVLEQRLGHARAEIAALRISTNGSEVVVQEPGEHGGGSEPLTGQFVLNFETAAIEKKVRALRETSAEEWFELGMRLDGRPETLEEAVSAYHSAINSSPDWVEAYINLGTTLFQLGRAGESREIFLSAVQIDPKNGLAHFNLGCAHERLGDTASAIKNFRAAIEFAPRMADAHLNLALACEKTGARSEALSHFSLCLRYDPHGPWADFVRKKIQATRPVVASGKVTPFRNVSR